MHRYARKMFSTVVSHILTEGVTFEERPRRQESKACHFQWGKCLGRSPAQVKGPKRSTILGWLSREQAPGQVTKERAVEGEVREVRGADCVWLHKLSQRCGLFTSGKGSHWREQTQKVEHGASMSGFES